MTGKSRTLLIWLGLIGIFVFLVLSRDSKTAQPTPFDTFRKLAAAGKIQEIWIDGNQIVFQIGNSGDRLSTTGFLDKDLEQTLEEGAAIHYGKPSSNNWFNDLSPTLLTLLVVIVVVVFLFRYAAKKRQGMFGDVFSMLKTRAMLIDSGKTVTFADVGGCADAKQSLRDVVDFLKDPKRWTAAGARLPRGVLLEGPPGCGKTLLARAVAGETNAKFYVVSASEFTEMFVGVGAVRVRDMFETAVKNAPAIVFIDELDAIGRRRGSGVGSGHDEREQTLNQLLVCLDGFKGNDRVVVLAATNRPEILDQALLRPGRFDRLVRVPELSREARLAVLKIHTRNKPLAANLDLDEWADRSSGMNGAQLESLANEAALLAVRRQGNGDGESPTLGQDDFQQAWETIRPKSPQFDKLDEVLIEAATQLAKPTGRAFARLTLSDGATIEGEVLWVNATFIKILPVEDESAVIVPKRQVARLEALAGTEAADSLEVASDLWANRLPGTM